MPRISRHSGIVAVVWTILWSAGCVSGPASFVHNTNCGSFGGGEPPHSGEPVVSGYAPCSTCPKGPGLVNRLGQGLHKGKEHVYQERPVTDCPRELTMVSHPPHRVAPPDILTIDLIRLVPRPPYRLEPLETLSIAVSDTLPNQPINGLFSISPEGTINLGYSYGNVPIGGLTVDEAQAVVRKHLSNILRNPQVTLTLVGFRGMQNIRGEHLVRPDGTISLGSYGSVYVAGMTLGQAKCVIEEYLSKYFLNPIISIDVFAYNSSVYYVIYDGAGFGQQVFRQPITGNERVLDAISSIQGLSPVSSKRHIWIARPSPVHMGCNQILPVDWNAITQGGSTATNYQIFPGDRIYVKANPLITFDNYLSQLFAPVERVLGLIFLANNAFQSNNNGN